MYIAPICPLVTRPHLSIAEFKPNPRNETRDTACHDWMGTECLTHTPIGTSLGHNKSEERTIIIIIHLLSELPFRSIISIQLQVLSSIREQRYKIRQLVYWSSIFSNILKMWKNTQQLLSVVFLTATYLLGSSVSVSALSTTSTATQAGKWQPKVDSTEERRRLQSLGHNSETIGSLGFHHIEFYCGDAKSTANQFALALGMPVTGITGQSTGNDQCITYGLTSGNFRILVTAPYSKAMASAGAAAAAAASTLDQEYEAPHALPQFSPDHAHEFFQKHGLAARAVGLHVRDAKAAYEASVANGAKGVLEPTFVPTCSAQVKKGVTSKGCFMSEVELYGDVVLRYVSFPDDVGMEEPSSSSSMPFLPHLAPLDGALANRKTFGIYRVDHAVGNVPNLFEAHNRIAKFTGFHEFAEFTTEDVGTVDSGLNSVVLASDKEEVLLPLNEPTPGRYVHSILTVCLVYS